MTSTLGKLLNRTPVPYAPKATTLGARIGSGVRGDMTAQLEAGNGVSTLFSIVDRISTSAAQVHWHLYRKQTDNRRTTAFPDTKPRTEITSHGALTVWNKPNPFMTGRYLREASQQHFELVGEYTTLVVRGLGIPYELWPVRPDRLTPVPHPTEFLAGWIYNGPNGEKVPLDVQDVLHVRRPNPIDPYRGWGVVQSLMVTLDSARASAEWNRNFFRNSAEPGGVVEFEDDMTDEEFEQFQDRWRSSHQGVSNAHRVALLENGLKWKQVTYSQRDMQFAELSGLSREIIREGFGIHSHMLGLTEDVNRANADAGEVSFARWITSDRVDRTEDMLNNTFLPMFGADSVEFEHERVVPEDREADDRERTSKANAAAALVNTGAWEPDDILNAIGWPEMRALSVEERVQLRGNTTRNDPNAAG